MKRPEVAIVMQKDGKSKRFTRPWVAGCLSLVSVAVTFLILELALRWLVPFGPKGTTYGRAVTFNSFGLRDREFSIPKPEDTHRVVVLGDSFTWGVGLDVEQTFPKLMEERLSVLVEGIQVEVVNAAETGNNTVEEFYLLRDKAIRYEPDQVLVIYNLNDIEYLPELSVVPYEEEGVPVVEIDPGEDITRFSRNSGVRGVVLEIERRSLFVRFLVPRVGSLLRRFGLIDSVEFSWVQKIYQGFNDVNPGWLESKRALAGIAELCRAADCDVLVAIYPLFADLENYKGREAHAKIVGFCREIGVPTVDLLPLFENTRTRSHWINLMDSHPNAVAHRAVAARLLPFLQEKAREVDSRKFSPGVLQP